MMTRRTLALGSVAVAALAATGVLALRWRGRANAAAETFEVTHTPEEWQKLLTPEQYAVLRQEDTERPFTSPLNRRIARAPSPAPAATCRCSCPTPSSTTGTGWPSFYAPIEGAVRQQHGLYIRHRQG